MSVNVKMIFCMKKLAHVVVFGGITRYKISHAEIIYVRTTITEESAFRELQV